MLTSWYVSTYRMTVRVDTNEQEVIVGAAPIVKKFIGQPMRNLLRWMSNWPNNGLRVERLSD